MKARELEQVSGNEYLSIEGASGELGIKESALRNYLSAGMFTTYKFKTLTLLDVNEVREWKQSRSIHRVGRSGPNLPVGDQPILSYLISASRENHQKT